MLSHSGTAPDGNRNKVLLVKGIAGLGNRIESLLTAMLYARLSGRRLVVDWSDREYSKDGTNAFHRFFESPLCAPSEVVPASDSVSPNLWRGRLQESAHYMRARFGHTDDSQTWRKFSIDLSRLDYTDDVLVLWTYVEQIDLLRPHLEEQFPELGRMSNKELLRKLLREDLTLYPETRKRVDAFHAQEFHGTVIGVHVRYSDHRTRLRAVLQKLNSLLRAEPGARIFLATDNARVKQMFEDNYAGVITTAHWYPSQPGMAIHKSEQRPSPVESGIEALVDLYLLAECTRLVLDTTSSFAYLATLLSRSPDANVFDVAEGRRNKASPIWRRITHRLMLKTGMFSWGIGLRAKLAKASGSRPRPGPRK